VRRIGRRLGVLAAAAIAVAGLSSTVPGSAAVHQAARTNAAFQQVARKKAAVIHPTPRTKAAWRKAIRHVRTPGRGCFRSSYPALAWHAVKCGTAPKVPSAPAQPARGARGAAPATVGGTGTGDDVAKVGGLISEATGTFWNVSSGITESGLIANNQNTKPVANAFSLQLNSNNNFTTPACSGGNSGCKGWEQFLYTYGDSSSSDIPTSVIFMQYWLLNYGAIPCPSGYIHPKGDTVNCYNSSQAADVSSLTASDLASVVFSGMAASGGADEVSMSVGSQAYAVSASDSVLDLAAGWHQTQWGVYGDAGSAKANFNSSSSLKAQTTIEVGSGPSTVTCGSGGFTGESNNLNLTTTSAIGSGDLPTMVSEQTGGTPGGAPLCQAAAGLPTAAGGLAADGLTATWRAQSDLGSTGSPQPLPTTTGDCGNWSGSDGTQVVGLGNGEDLWTFGDTYLGPAVARQDFFNNGFIDNSMVVQNGSAFTTITGGSGCGSGQPTTAAAPITASGGKLWPASSIVYGSDVEKFYYTVNSSLVQQQPQVAEIPQSSLESGNTYSAQALALSGCTANPIMWGAASISSGGYTYIYGSQQFSSTGGDTGGEGGGLYLARAVGDPSDQASWEYYTTSGWSQEGASCGGLALAALGGSQSIEVPTEFSVTSVNGDFWLVDQDPVNGDQPGWAVAHGATTPWGFSNNPAASVDLFVPTQTTFSGIDDSVPGLKHYAVRMLEPSAVTPTQPGDVVIAYNVNSSEVDGGCIPLLDYDANAYRPRFIDVPASDLAAQLSAAPAALRKPAQATASPGTPGKPATAAAGGRATRPKPPAPVIFSPQMAARGGAQLKAARAGSQAAASTSWTYPPDAVPPGTWSGTCPGSYPAVDPQIEPIIQNLDGSVEVSWPNRDGPDVWYWFHWQDDTSNPGVWHTNQFWTAGPNADSYLAAPPAGAFSSTSTTISQIFTLPSGTNPGDKFSFWVQAFAAGNGNAISPDSSATAVSYTPTSPQQGVSGLTATPGTGSVTLNWTAAPAPVTGQAIWYSVRYKTLSASTWTYTTNYITNTADMTPLTGGTQYEFEVAVTDAETTPTNATWSAPVDATPHT
jgi:hypothetical protein